MPLSRPQSPTLTRNGIRIFRGMIEGVINRSRAAGRGSAMIPSLKWMARTLAAACRP